MLLLESKTLERSSVVANSAMNRERVCVGGNSYTKELSLNPVDLLRPRLKSQEHVAWLDLCCGTGKALIEASRILSGDVRESNLTIIGIDLVGMFEPYPSELGFLQMQEASVMDWEPDCSFDLITCVHGLHYIGDKLDLIQRAISWLKEDGFFAANLDPTNLKFANGDIVGRRMIRELKKYGVDYKALKHLIVCEGRRKINLGYQYLGADDKAGPNYTGQAAVDSYYRLARNST